MKRNVTTSNITITTITGVRVWVELPYVHSATLTVQTTKLTIESTTTDIAKDYNGHFLANLNDISV